jgi:hypothetical protein
MRKPLLLIVAALLAVAVAASSALAAVNVKSEPTATFSGASVNLTGGNFSGLGSVPAIAELTVTGEATFTCTNPQGHASPGQNPVPAEPGTAEQDTGNADHKGRGTIENLSASVTAPDPPPTAGQVGCGGQGASDKWTVVLNDLTATAAHLELTQDGTIVFCRNYTLGGPATGTPC